MVEESLEYIPDFVARREEYVLHNAGPDAIHLTWAGRPFTIPGCDEIHPTKPALYDDGSPIPGTVRLRDDYKPKPDGTLPREGDPYNWRAAIAIKNVLGINKDGKAVGPYARKGVSWVRMPTTEENIKKLMAAGKRRYYDFMVNWADHQVRAYAESVDRANRAGVTAGPPGADYHKAVTILNQHKEEMEKRYGKQKEDLAELAEEDDVEFMLWAKARLAGMAKQAAEAHDIAVEKLVEDSLNDPEMLKKLRKQYRIRKIGYAEGVTEERAVDQPEEKEPRDTQQVVIPPKAAESA